MLIINHNSLQKLSKASSVTNNGDNIPPLEIEELKHIWVTSMLPHKTHYDKGNRAHECAPNKFKALINQDKTNISNNLLFYIS